MNPLIVIGSGLVVWGLFVCGMALLIRDNSPEGYQDKDGFHYGPHPRNKDDDLKP